MLLSLSLTPWKNRLKLFRKTNAAMIQWMRKTWGWTNVSSLRPLQWANLLCSILLKNENPEAAGKEEEDGEHLVESRQGHLPEQNT